MHVLIGLDYDTYGIADEEIGKGHFTIERRNVSLKDIVTELLEYLIVGSHYPQFIPQAHPEVVYAYDLNKQEDADIYDIINNELIKSMEK